MTVILKVRQVHINSAPPRSYWSSSRQPPAGGHHYGWALNALGGNLHVSDEVPAAGFAHTMLRR